MGMKVLPSNLNGDPLDGDIASARGGVTSGTGATIVFSAQIPANSVAPGQMFRVKVLGQSSSIGTLIFSGRAGINGTTADAIPAAATVTSAAQAANQWATYEAYFRVLTVGSSGTVVAAGVATAQGSVHPPVAAAEVTATFNNQGAWFISVACTCSSGTFTVRQAVLEAL